MELKLNRPTGKSAIEHKVDEFNEKNPSLHIQANRYDMTGDFTVYARSSDNTLEEVGEFDIYSIYLESTHPDCNVIGLTAEEFIAIAGFMKWLRNNYLKIYEEMQEDAINAMTDSIIGPEGSR